MATRTGATEAWSSGLQAAQVSSVKFGGSSCSSSFGGSVVLCCKVRKVVLCCISSNKHKKQTCPTTKECGARRFVMIDENGGMWHCGSVA